MSFFAGLLAATPGGVGAADRDRVRALADGQPGLASPRLWSGDGGVMAHAQALLTVEDRQERQPSTCGGGRFVLAFDGCLSNRRELIDTLGLAADGRVQTDSALVAASLLRWGGDAPGRLLGAFALAWWDRVERRLLLACDQTGGRALFYHCTADRIVFATTLPAMLGFPTVPRQLDEAMLGQALLPYLTNIGRTCYREVAHLPAAGRLLWSGGTARVDRYWRPDFSRRLRYARDEDYVEAARELLDRVVGDSLRAEGPVVSLLSGGLDSTAVAATAARLTAPKPLHTITLRPDPSASLPQAAPGYFQDEWGHAQAVAAMHPSMVPHAVPAAPDSLDDDLLRFMMSAGHPPPHLFAATWHGGGRRLARELGATVLLTGFSGNATLSYDARHVPSMLAGMRDWGGAWQDAVLHWRQGQGLVPVGDRFARLMAPSWLRSAYRRWRGQPAPWLPPAIRPDAAERIGLADRWNAWAVGDHAIPYRYRQRLWALERTWIGRMWGGSQRLNYGLELRDPLGDLRLVEFCLALPPEQYVRGKVSRYLARRVLADRLPDVVVNETRIGRQAPEWFDWLSRRRDWLAAELDRIDQSSMGQELIDVPRLRGLLADWPADADAAGPHHLALMNSLGRGVVVGRFIRWAEGDNG